MPTEFRRLSAVLRFVVCACMMVVGLMAGCADEKRKLPGDVDQEQLRKDMKVLGTAYLQFMKKNPSGPQDWNVLTHASPENEEVFKRIRRAEVQVKWGITDKSAKVYGADKFVLAEHLRSGLKLMLDGTVKD
jgi:hypothetical protein